MENFNFWYLKYDYLPIKRTVLIDNLLNKLTYILLFVLAFGINGFLNGFRNRINADLDDPYFNSIPASVGLSSFSEENIPDKYFDVSFDPYEFLGYINVLKYNSEDSIHLRGYSIPPKHPFQYIVEDHILSAVADFSSEIRRHGLIISENALINKIGHKESVELESSNPLILKFLDFGLYTLEDPNIPINAVASQLPNNIDFLIFDDFLIENQQRERIIKKKSYWNLLVNQNSQNFDTLFESGNIIKELLTEQGFEDLSFYPNEDGKLPGRIQFNFDMVAMDLNELQTVINELNEELSVHPHYSGQMVEIADTNSYIIKSHSFNQEERLKVWEYFTITPNFEKKDEIYKLKDELEGDFPGINIEMKSVDSVFALNRINGLISTMEIFFLIIILFTCILLNYKILRLHIFRKAGHLGYLRSIGVSLGRFKQLYTFEALLETLVAVLFGLMIVYPLNLLMPSDIFSFSLLSTENLLFCGVMAVLMIISYRYVINKMLNKSLREILDS